MAKSKAFKKFASSGKLKDTIKSRRCQQQKRRKFEDAKTQRKKQRGAPAAEDLPDGEDGSDGEEEEDDEREVKGLRKGGRAGGVAQTVDELFGGNLEDGLGDGSDLEELSEDDEDEEEESDDDEEDLVRDEAAMKKTLKELEKNDPDFFKYLKDNDRDLLDFEGKGKGRDMEDNDMDGGMDDDEDEDMEVDQPRRKVQVTSKMIKGWQEGMIKQNSIRALRNVTIAFRAAAHMNEEGANEGSGSETKYAIDSPKVFNQLVITGLKYPPAVIAHHMPHKTLANGRVKLQPLKKPNASLQRLLLSHLSTILHLIKSLPSKPSSAESSDETGGLLLSAVNESSRLVPWILSEKKHLRAYLKVRNLRLR